MTRRNIKVVKKIIDENPQSIEDYRNGKKESLGFLVGLVIKKLEEKQILK